MSLQQHYDALVERHRLLKEQYQELEAANRRHHTTADALHQIHCTAACPNSAHRCDGLGNAGVTEDIVIRAREQMRRLEAWWSSQSVHIRQAALIRNGYCGWCEHWLHDDRVCYEMDCACRCTKWHTERVLKETGQGAGGAPAAGE